ncbi:hypothetical protein RRF57_011336 [Xylaria bambusicola]|uniref:Uncharacterized protein n=1 Tax=Xylaria bambusicola TaxID=326684 RepID=A0AAN7V2L0_9PEZI
MAAHDITWAGHLVETAVDFKSCAIQDVLFNGLGAVESISKAETYSQQQEAFDHVPSYRVIGLYRALLTEHIDSTDHQNTMVLNLKSSQEYASQVMHPFFDDPDDGPFTIWRWAHEQQPLSRSVNRWKQSTLSKGGYVLWDRARLDALGILKQHCQPHVIRALIFGDLLEKIW